MKTFRSYAPTLLVLFLVLGAAQPAHAAYFGDLLSSDPTVFNNTFETLLLDMGLSPELITSITAVSYPKVTCSTYCYPSYYNYIGGIRLELTCDAQSPPIYNAQLMMNGTSTPIHTKVCPTACTSAPNICGVTATGMTGAGGLCEAVPPPLPASYGTACTSTGNVCGIGGAGYTLCNGTCSSAPPLVPYNYGSACSLTSAPNVCGQTVTASNTGTYNCSGTCSGTAPAAPPVTTPTGKPYLGACTVPSTSSACGVTTPINVSGVYNCAGICAAKTTPNAPPGNTCAPPSAPILDGLWKNGIKLGTTVPAYDPTGYQLYAMATSSSNANLIYYFQWATTSTSFSNTSTDWSDWVSSGSWGYVTHFNNTAPGTYYARAWTYDSNGNWSAKPSAVLPITLVTPPIQATCTVDKDSGPVNTTFTWEVNNVTGGNHSYTYSWTGTDGITGSGTYIPKSYTTGGTKTASVTVSSAGTSQTFTCPTVTILAPDLVAGNTSVTPAFGMEGVVGNLSATVTNIGTYPAATFPNMFAINRGFLEAPDVDANTVTSFAVGASTVITSSYTFPSAGTYGIRACANQRTSNSLVKVLPIAELTRANNCGREQTFTVYPALASSCAVTPTSGLLGTQFLWTHGTTTGGSGSYTYTWTGTNISPSVTSDSLAKTYPTTGAKSASVTVTDSVGNWKTFACANTALVSLSALSLSVLVSPASYTVTLPTSTTSATYTLTNGTATDTNCRLLSYAGTALSSYAPCTGSQLVTTPSSAGTFGYYIQANKSATGETVTSNLFTVTVVAPTNGVCSAAHYACAVGASTNNIYNSRSGLYTWNCTGTNGGTTAPCSESKAAPASGILTVPPSCVIASGGSTCTVTASWSTTNATGAYLFDRNVGSTLYTATSSIDSTVYVANPQTVFDLKDGNGTVLDTKTVTASCAAGSTWDGTTCVAITTFTCTSLPANANAYIAPDNTGLSANTPYTYASANTSAKCEFSCANGYTWDGNSCTVPCLASLSATPSTVEQGNYPSLTWSVTGGSLCASSCSGGSGFNTGGAISGTGVFPYTAPNPPSTSYSLTCTPGTAGSAAPVNTTVTVTIPSPNVTVNQQTINGVTDSGGTTSGSVIVDPAVPDNVVITWAPPNASIVSCSLSKKGVLMQSDLPPAGTITDTVTTKTTYVLDCRNAQGAHVKKTIIVNILLNYQEF